MSVKSQEILTCRLDHRKNFLLLERGRKGTLDEGLWAYLGSSTSQASHKPEVYSSSGQCRNLPLVSDLDSFLTSPHRCLAAANHVMSHAPPWTSAPIIWAPTPGTLGAAIRAMPGDL